MSSFKEEEQFVYVLILGLLTFCTFYWYNSFTSGRHKTDSSMGLSMGSFARWRWECNFTLKQCERHAWNDGEALQSLRTCQMTCEPISIWPHPRGELVLSNESLSFKFKGIIILPVFAQNMGVRNLLSEVIQIFKEDITPCSISPPWLVHTKADVNFLYLSTDVVGKTNDIDYRLGMDESYKLLVENTERIVRVSIRSATFFGARHALETLRQLIWYEESDGLYRIISRVKITDSPSFTYRGLLLDTANNYIPVSGIKRTIYGMAAVKMNVFHWHMTGPKSFPYAFKNLQHAMYGAYSSKKVYTHEDVSDIIEYARLRGVKVLIEIDNPGGLGRGWSWGQRSGDGDLNVNYKHGINTFLDECNHLNPNNNNSYKYYRDILEEFRNISEHPDVYHLGGSVDLRCWINSPEVQGMEIYKQKGIEGILKYHQNMLKMIMSDIYKTKLPDIILWSDYFKQFSNLNEMMDTGLYIAQIKSESIYEDEKDLLNKGYRVILSHEDKWDLSRLPHWFTVYDHAPWDRISHSRRKHILGGEALVWTKLIDEYTLDTKVWPVAAALAEVLWTDPEIKYLSNVVSRMQSLRERLVERGIHASSLGPKWCLQNPGGCL